MTYYQSDLFDRTKTSKIIKVIALKGVTMAGEKLVCFDFDDTLVNAHFHSLLSRDADVVASYGGAGIQIQQSDGSCNLYNEGQYQGTIPKQGSGAPLSKINQLIGIGRGNPPPGLKNPQAIANAIRQAIDNGHKVAITSFTHYPEVAVPTLNAIMQTIMPPDVASRYVNQVCVVGGYPSNGITGLKKDTFQNYIDNPNFRGKEEHIHAAISHFNQQPGVQLTRSDAMLIDDNKPNIDIAARYGRVQKVPELPNPPLANNNYVAPIMTHVSANVRMKNTPIAKTTPIQTNQMPTAAKPYMGQLPPQPVQGTAAKQQTSVQASMPQTTSNLTAAVPKPYMGQLPPRPAASAPVATKPVQSPAPQNQPVSLSPIRGPVPQPLQAAMARPVPQPIGAAPSVQQNVQLPPPPIQGPTPVPPTAVPSNYARFTAVTNQQPAATNLPPLQTPITSNYARFTTATNQNQPSAKNAQPAPIVYERLPPIAPTQQATNQPGGTNLPPPVDQKLAQEADQIDALKAIFDTPITTLKGQYESFSKAKHASENQGMLHSFAKSIAKSVSGIAKERNQQVNDISQALQAIKNAPNLNALDKATLAYAHLESVKAAMGSGKSGIKDLCDSLGKQIESAVPGAKDNYHSNAIGHIAQAENIVGKINDPQQQPTHNKPR